MVTARLIGDSKYHVDGGAAIAGTARPWKDGGGKRPGAAGCPDQAPACALGHRTELDYSRVHMLDTLFNRSGSATEAFLDNLARRLHAAGCTANAITYAALGSGVLAGMLFLFDHNGLAFTAALLSGLLDAVDGRVARLGSGPTPWGGVLDLTFDRIVEASILLGVAMPRPHLHLPALVLAATWYVNLCVFLAVGAASDAQREKLIVYPPGLLERGESLIFLFVVVVLPRLAAAGAYIFAVLEVVTAAQRLRYGRLALR